MTVHAGSSTMSAAPPAGGIWTPCIVVGYSDLTGAYSLIWRDDASPTQSASTSVPTGSVHHVYPIHVIFNVEDPELFANRVARAHTLRRQAEAAIRYNLYVDSMPVDESETLDSEQVARIKRLCHNTPAFLRSRPDVSSLFQEVHLEYSRTMNKIIFDANLRDPTQLSLRVGLAPGFTLPEGTTSGGKGGNRVKRSWNRSMVPRHEFANHYSDFCFSSVFTRSEALLALIKVNTECLRLQTDKRYLFVLSVPKAMRLDEFEQQQTSSIHQVANMLKDKWVASLKTAVVSSLQTAGKGWFNLQERSADVYSFSKLKRFMTLTSFMMQDSLRFLVQDSFAKFAAFIRRMCSYRVTINSTSQVRCLYDPCLFIPQNKDNDPLVKLMQIDVTRFMHALATIQSEFPVFQVELTVRDNKETDVCYIY